MTRVLLVDDEELNIDMLKRRLERRNYEVVVATSGLEALAKARAEWPDVILMDVGLPDIDGWEASRRLKADPATKAIPIIAVTAHAMADHRTRSLEAGCDDFQSKPIDFAQLCEKIDALTAKRPPGG